MNIDNLLRAMLKPTFKRHLKFIEHLQEAFFQSAEIVLMQTSCLPLAPCGMLVRTGEVTSRVRLYADTSRLRGRRQPGDFLLFVLTFINNMPKILKYITLFSDIDNKNILCKRLKWQIQLMTK